MSLRWFAPLVVLLSTAAISGQRAPKLNRLLDGATTLPLTLEAPLHKLFANKKPDDDSVFVSGTLTFKDPEAGSDVVMRDIQVSVRGHTSRNDAECTFPKLKVKAKPGGTLKIGTHCGELPDDRLSAKYGRLANEKSPLREALTYRILDALGVPTLRTRPARVTYIDPDSGGAPLVRGALLVEDDADAMARVDGTRAIGLETFGNVKTRNATEDGSRIAFGEAAIANFDWCLKFAIVASVSPARTRVYFGNTRTVVVAVEMVDADGRDSSPQRMSTTATVTAARNAAGAT